MAGPVIWTDILPKYKSLRVNNKQSRIFGGIWILCMENRDGERKKGAEVNHFEISQAAFQRLRQRQLINLIVRPHRPGYYVIRSIHHSRGNWMFLLFKYLCVLLQPFLPPYTAFRRPGVQLQWVCTLSNTWWCFDPPHFGAVSQAESMWRLFPHGRDWWVSCIHLIKTKTKTALLLFSSSVSPKLSACCFVFQPSGTTRSFCPVTGIIEPHSCTQ